MDGTLKYNIDPLSNYSDDQIKQVLKNIGLSYIVESNEKGLLQKVNHL